MANTANRGYPLPDVADTIAEEFYKFLNSTLPLIDGDVHALIQLLAAKAPVVHAHDIAQVNGLADALAAKMASNRTFTLEELTDVSGTVAAPDNYVLIKQAGAWLAVSFAAAVSAGGGVAVTQVNGLSDALNSINTTLNAPKPLGSLSDVDFTVKAPAIGDSIVWNGSKWLANPGGAGEPVGRITLLLGNTPDPGWLAFGEGGTYDTAAFPDLTAWMGVNFPELAPGNFPDWRGYSPRTTGGALAPSLRTKQEDAFQGFVLGIAGVSRSLTGYDGYANNDATSVKPSGVYGASAVTADTIVPISNGVHGTPRTASETRAKTFGVRWQIKASGAVTNPGAADMAVISTIAGAAVRRDIDQGAQAFSAPQKVNILKNTLQAWERIGGKINLAGQTTIDWTGLEDFATLRLLIGGAPSATSAPQLRLRRLGQPAFDSGAAEYQYGYSYHMQTGSFTASYGSADRLYIALSSWSPSYGGSAEVLLQQFNLPRLTYVQSRVIEIGGATPFSWADYKQYHNSLAICDGVRLSLSAGAWAEGYAILEGSR